MGPALTVLMIAHVYFARLSQSFVIENCSTTVEIPRTQGAQIMMVQARYESTSVSDRKIYSGLWHVQAELMQDAE